MQSIRGLVLVAVVGVLALSVGHGQERQPSLMQKKLKHAQSVLEGIAVNDFVKIADNASDLIAISKAAEWQVLKTARYELYSNEFRRTAETLQRQAKAKNVEGATLAYVDMTLTCVKCHQHVREERMGKLDLPHGADALARSAR